MSTFKVSSLFSPILATACLPVFQGRAANSILLGWNNLGMHFMDSDYSVFSILPPYNTIEAQLIVGGKLVTNGTGYTVTYEAMADPSGSFNSTSAGKGNYYSLFKQFTGPRWCLTRGWRDGTCPA
jgi:hypothetical protein